MIESWVISVSIEATACRPHCCLTKPFNKSYALKTIEPPLSIKYPEFHTHCSFFNNKTNLFFSSQSYQNYSDRLLVSSSCKEEHIKKCAHINTLNLLVTLNFDRNELCIRDIYKFRKIQKASLQIYKFTWNNMLICIKTWEMVYSAKTC